MGLTRNFKETVQARVRTDPEFAKELLREGIERLMKGELEIGKSLLRDYINATLGFTKLAKETRTPAKSLMRMFSPEGNPHARNLIAVLGALLEEGEIDLTVHCRPSSQRGATSKERGRATTERAA